MYIVIEIQTNADGLVGTIVTQHESWQAAEAKYHTVLAAAAVSSLPVHAAVILTGDGNVVRGEHYTHGGEEA